MTDNLSRANIKPSNYFKTKSSKILFNQLFKINIFLKLIVQLVVSLITQMIWTVKTTLGKVLLQMEALTPFEVEP
jgi:hypothetical protein